MREHLQMGPKQDTTANTLFSIEEVACLGACGIAPVITVDEEVYGKLEPENAVEIISRYEEAEKGKEG
jgi:NADH-quinone oxidoreductase subunit E